MCIYNYPDSKAYVICVFLHISGITSVESKKGVLIELELKWWLWLNDQLS